MKKAAFLSLIAAFVFGLNIPQANAATVTEEGPSTRIPASGAEIIWYDATGELVISVSKVAKRERIFVDILGKNDKLILSDVFLAEGTNTIYEVNLEGVEAGLYQVYVHSESIDTKSQINVK